jgi:hypothetical protein
MEARGVEGAMARSTRSGQAESAGDDVLDVVEQISKRNAENAGGRMPFSNRRNVRRR